MSKYSNQRLAVLDSIDALLPAEVYDGLYAEVIEKKPLEIVEVGTAHGGGTIAMALAAKDENLGCKIFTIDTLEAFPDIPSSRVKHGSRDKNKMIVADNFKRAGVSDSIELFVGRSDQFPAEDKLQKCDILVLDADGRIDRDLILFKDYLSDDAVVIIDDIEGGPKLSNASGKKTIDLKHVAVKALLGQFVDSKMLKIKHIIGHTAFCQVITPGNWTDDQIKNIALKAYRELVFTDVSTHILAKRFLYVVLRELPFFRAFLPLLRLLYKAMGILKIKR